MTSTVNLEEGLFINVQGTRTHYHDVGEGAPVLLLHGSGPGVSAWANWQHAIPSLAENSRVLALDIVGFGHTERPDDVRYSLRTWTDHVWNFLDALGIDKVSIIGNSLGGRIACQMAEDNDTRLDRIVLMGAPGVGMTLTEGLKALRAYEPSPENMRNLLINYFAVDSSIITDDLVRIRYEASAAPGAHEAYHLMFFSPDHAGSELAITEEQVRAITAPTLLVHGREDRVVPVDVAWNMVHLLPDGDLHVFSRCGHWTQIERSAEFNSLVKEFLRITA
ncbi:putative meta-cleavage compound hydrolase [Gordonia polyisoprenivorans NBRC 16320 = JCM 10675]|uniref:Alpha/beta fold hydrolase n=1 Tax=Gordonia polyisoprenivorans TaxID=84595 RepID=A0A846WKX0_9ACTN|nr:alpha/beta hydrolase [Gordonia polyisoprenivorans]NKY01473.1 alpha/beta fold hydrolase [Gordonia polyisoprenivorans]GAB26354.1 putative meta-cleavage compound hydrolase [Gordonia polyisoprenivorans NBRC 16320 = JCM 10675]